MTNFFHVTSSATLVGLAKSEFKLCSPMDLMVVYNHAPMTGEISAGGCRGATINPGIAFAQEGSSYWTLEGILRNYGQRKWTKKIVDEKALTSRIDLLIKNNFLSLTEVIVELMRDQQMGVYPMFTPALIDDLCQKIDAQLRKVLQYYYRNYIICASLEYGPTKGCTAIEVHSCFMKHLLDFIPLDFFDLSENDKQTFYAGFEEIFKKAMQTRPSEFSDVSFNQYFQRVTAATSEECYFPRYAFDTAMIYPDRLDFIYDYLGRDEGDLHRKMDFEQLEAEIKMTCNMLKQQVERLKNLLIETGAVALTEKEKAICTSSFPLLFIVENETKLQECGYEFRATSMLKLGEDITKLAVYAEDMDKLTEFLKQYNLEHITVLSIEALIAKNNTKPTPTCASSLFHHQPNRYSSSDASQATGNYFK